MKRKSKASAADEILAAAGLGERPGCVGPYSAAFKATLGTWPIRYAVCWIIDGAVSRTSGYTAGSHLDYVKAVHVARPPHCACWAEDRDGLILYGIDPQGNSRAPISNLTTYRDFHTATPSVPDSYPTPTTNRSRMTA